MKISHESPISMLEQSRSYNDYDYALVHLFETRPDYFKFFKDSLSMGRRVILDNSIFELGTAFDSEKYVQWINELKPTEYIIPDVLEDEAGTTSSAFEFISKYKNLPGLQIGVVQGKTYEELVRCYKTLDQGVVVDKLAISFDYSYYLEVFPHPNKWVSYAMGRVLTLNRLLKDNIINTSKPHHLLGCAHPLEFSFYQHPDFKWLESLDTSSPIVHGILGIKYEHEVCGWAKRSTKLVDLIDAVPDEYRQELIKYNIKHFRNLVNDNNLKYYSGISQSQVSTTA